MSYSCISLFALNVLCKDKAVNYDKCNKQNFFYVVPFFSTRVVFKSLMCINILEGNIEICLLTGIYLLTVFLFVFPSDTYIITRKSARKTKLLEFVLWIVWFYFRYTVPFKHRYFFFKTKSIVVVETVVSKTYFILAS